MPEEVIRFAVWTAMSHGSEWCIWLSAPDDL
jgi:hypothetical protein